LQDYQKFEHQVKGFRGTNLSTLEVEYEKFENCENNRFFYFINRPSYRFCQ